MANQNRSSNISHLTSASKGNRASVPMAGLSGSKVNKSKESGMEQISVVSGNASETTKMNEEHNMMMIMGMDDPDTVLKN